MSHRQLAAEPRTEAAQLAGSVALVTLALLAVNMPEGLLGPADTLTRFGLWYGLGLAAAAVVAVVGRFRGWRWCELLPPVMLAVSIGVFVPALPTDPVLAGLVVGWLLYRLLRVLLPPRTALSRPQLHEDPLSRWLERHGRAVRHLASMAVLLTVLAAGYGVGDRLPAFVVCLVVHGLTFAWSARLGWLALRTGARWPLLSLALVAAAVASAGLPAASLALLACAQLPVLAVTVSHTPAAAEILGHFLSAPALLVAVSFIALIGIGTLLLSFPVAAAGGEAIRPVDALFTSTSAACVTGLVVLDTGTAFSTFGQVVILLLIQAGGLSIMVLSTFAALLLGQRLGIRGELTLGEVLDQESSRSALRLVRFVVLSTFAIEAVGAAGLATADAAAGTSPLESVWWGVFHAVSAFCNAGFALQSQSLAGWVGAPWVLLLVAGLIIAGGLGFPVLLSVWSLIRRQRSRPGDLQTRIVLLSTAILLAGGTVWILLAEAGRALDGLGPVDMLVNAFFQSATLRTAGFNSVDLNAMAPVTVLMMLVLMFVGASPGGTGGGIKTTTTVVLLGAVPAILRRRQQVVLGRRTVSLETVFRSAAITVIAVLTVLIGSAALLATQAAPFDQVLFEAVSAFGTVGLSLGVTPHLDTFGRIVVVLLMFAGRIGPLTLALLLGRGLRSRVQYPETRIMVG